MGNFAPLTALDWQVHVYGEASPEIEAVCAALELPLHIFPSRPEMGVTGLRRNAVYLVRPDGYIALVSPSGTRLDRKIAEWMEKVSYEQYNGA